MWMHIGGYDLLKAAHIMIDTQSAEVWSKHPDVVRHASFADNIFVTVPASSEECGVTPQSIPEFPLRHSSKFNKIKIHTHTHTLFIYRLSLFYFYTLYFYKVIILALIL